MRSSMGGRITPIYPKKGVKARGVGSKRKGWRKNQTMLIGAKLVDGSHINKITYSGGKKLGEYEGKAVEYISGMVNTWRYA